MSASGLYGPTRACAGIVGHVDLTLGARARDGARGAHRGRRRPLPRHPPTGGWDPSPEVATPTPTRRRASTPRPTIAPGVAELGQLGLTFDAWLYHPQLPDVTAWPGPSPADHDRARPCGGPLGIGPYAGKTDAVFAAWKADIAELARCPNVVVKLGGLGMDIGPFLDHMSRPARPRRRSSPTPGGPRSRPASKPSAPAAACSRAISRSTRSPTLRHAVERLQADGRGRFGGREDGPVQRHGEARVQAVMIFRTAALRARS